MWILAIETSTPSGSVAVRGPAGALTELEVSVAGRHGDVLVAAVRDCLATSGRRVGELSGLAASVGPGSFTGVRSALGVIKGLALATGLPVLGVGSLEALAAPALRRGVEGDVLALLDARRGEVFAAVYAAASADGGGGAARPPTGEPGAARVAPLVGTPAAVAARLRELLPEGSPLALVGQAVGDAALVGPLVAALGERELTLGEAGPPAAAEIAALAAARFERGERDDVATLDACYVRPADARLPAPPRWVSRPDGRA